MSFWVREFKAMIKMSNFVRVSLTCQFIFEVAFSLPTIHLDNSYRKFRKVLILYYHIVPYFFADTVTIATTNYVTLLPLSTAYHTNTTAVDVEIITG